jgi:UPF0042 nucleotide-binding protein
VSVWVITGLSGAGKATALAGLESAGVECVDNLPVALLEAFSAQARARPAAAVVDARQGALLEDISVDAGRRILFLDAGDDVLVRRIADSTRPHPGAHRGRGRSAVDAERAVLAPLRAAADVVIDTTSLSPAELQQRVRELVVPDGGAGSAAMTLTLSSFGFKFGAPVEADWVIDARMMRNPFWDLALRPLTGLDAPVREFVLAQPEAEELLRRLDELLRWALSAYAGQHRRFLHVAIGCTGGRHRSVALVEALASRLADAEMTVTVRHRDVAAADPRVSA